MPRAPIRFVATLWSPREGKGWTFVDLPKEASDAWGARGRVAVRGTINGCAFRSSVFLNGAGSHRLQIDSAMRSGARSRPVSRRPFH